MGIITIRRGKLEIDVRSQTDLEAVLNVLGERNLQLPLTNKPRLGQADNPKPTYELPSEESLQNFYKSMNGKLTQRFINALFDNQNGLQDIQIRKLLGLDSNLKLAGVVATVMKAEKRLQLPPQSILIRARSGSAGDYRYNYDLSNDFRKAIESIVHYSK